MSPFNRCHKPFILHTSPNLRKFGQIHYPFSYQLTSWFAWKSAPPVTFHLLALPCGAWADILSHTLASLLPHQVFADMDAFRHWAGLLNVPFDWRRYVDIPSYPLLAEFPLRNRLGEPYLSQGLSTLNSLYKYTHGHRLFNAPCHRLNFVVCMCIKTCFILKFLINV